MSGPDMHFLNTFALNVYPTCIAQILILMECVRTIPAECRMYRRAWRRKRFNAAEILFLAIKYLSIVSWSCDAVVQNTDFLPTASACTAAHVVSYFTMFLAVHFVALAIACRKAYWYLAVALAGHLSLSLWTAQKQHKASEIVEGFCNIKPFAKRGVWTFSVVYWLLYNIMYDAIVTGFATWRLLCNVNTLSGLSQVSKVLFVNNIHYVIIVCGANTTEFVYLAATHGYSRSLIGVSCAIQILTGLNLLIKEQDIVHSKAPIHVSRARSMGRDDHSPSTGNVHFQQSTFSSQNAQSSFPTFNSHASSNNTKVGEQAPFHHGSYDLNRSCSVADVEKDGIGSWPEREKDCPAIPAWDWTPMSNEPFFFCRHDDSNPQTVHVTYPILTERTLNREADDVVGFDVERSGLTTHMKCKRSMDSVRFVPSDGRTRNFSTATEASQTSIRAIRSELKSKRESRGEVAHDSGLTPVFEISQAKETPPALTASNSVKRKAVPSNDAKLSCAEPAGCHHTGDPSGQGEDALHTPPRSQTASSETHTSLRDTLDEHNGSLTRDSQHCKPVTSDCSSDLSVVASTFGGEYRGSLIHGPHGSSSLPELPLHFAGDSLLSGGSDTMSSLAHDDDDEHRRSPCGARRNVTQPCTRTIANHSSSSNEPTASPLECLRSRNNEGASLFGDNGKQKHPSPLLARSKSLHEGSSAFVQPHTSPDSDKTSMTISPGRWQSEEQA